ncbi:Na(+)-linked D-alanine glycine permease [Nonlabens tegetincola]|uniref:Na(+)-linked D-alanine glycine permease n=1 Tax=Nonlabens tegetincola TaxID=323273 RepID=A0A090Q813_9FLAO|nr:amino acid carrier protein [Nonlabens tegetincola]GAK97878.1 Na(+)-linked D-alanine glycine permease [Nonlabens tegetincola]
MRSIYILVAAFLITTLGNAQELILKAQTTNPTSEINDGSITVTVSGGKAPYTYKWSNQSTPLKSNTATSLTEGINYTVEVTDADGNNVAGVYEVKAESIVEHLNGAAVPAVGALGNVLFWDLFSAIGIYDPVVYAESKKISIPNWEAGDTNKYTLKQWLKNDGEKVKKGDEVAIVAVENGQDVVVSSPASGEFNHLQSRGKDLNPGDVIYNGENSGDVIETGAHLFAQVKYDEKVPLLHPNGDVQQKPIPFIVIWLVLGALFFTLRMGFINFRGFKHSIDLAKGKYDDPTAPGQVTHFQALATAVSGTVGLGNIASVAVAISIGGAGATFWMIVAGLLGMSSKFVECTLGVKYRDISNTGAVYGGPMNYLRYGLEKQNKKGLGKVLAVLFAVLAIGASFGGGNMFQSNQAFEGLATQFTFLEGHGFIFGIITAVLVGVVIIGGIQSIAKVTGKIVPFMASVYIIAALAVIIINIENVGPAFSAIIDGAFSPSALKGGVIGVLIIGFQRAAFSNEAGVGSAAIAHSAAKTHHPPSEGFVALLEPFIDTVVVCTLTALVLIFTGMHEVEGLTGAQLTSDAFGSVISWFPYVLAGAIFLFAFSTMISWSYYGMRAWTYLFGKGRMVEIAYKMIFLIFVVIGSSVSLGAVLDFSDMMILAMSFPNIIGLYLMSGEVKRDLNEYWRKLKSGELGLKKDA